MFPPIVCHCGRSHGDKYPLFREMRADRIDEYMRVNHIQATPDMYHTVIGLNIEFGDILDKLALYLDCCRARMLSTVEYKDYY